MQFIGERMKLPFSHDEYRRRQLEFLNQLPDDSIVIIPTNSKKQRSNDTNYRYRANSYVLYLCGWSEPDAIFYAYKNQDLDWKTTLYVNDKDTKKEIWEGRILGVDGAAKYYPVDEAADIESWIDYLEDEIYDNDVYYLRGNNPTLDSLVDDDEKHRLDMVEEMREGFEVGDRLSSEFIVDPNCPDPEDKYFSVTNYLDKMRVIKSNTEIELMKKSAELACKAHIVAMKSGYSGINECHIQSIIEGYFVSNMSHWAYPSIVGGGDNATILHYNKNQDVINDGDLVLIDAGCEIDGYASDITRTWPVNGVFSDAQREIYELVLEAEKAAIDACQVGAPWKSFHEAASRVLAQGLIDLGILECTLEDALGDDLNGPYRNYFMHGTGHMLGLDVHDVGGGRQGDGEPGPVFTAGMVLTVEPGLYFASWRTDVPIPERYSGIGVRIEDNILITDDGPVVLTESCPKEISEIESLIGTGE